MNMGRCSQSSEKIFRWRHETRFGRDKGRNGQSARRDGLVNGYPESPERYDGLQFEGEVRSARRA